MNDIRFRYWLFKLLELMLIGHFIENDIVSILVINNSTTHNPLSVIYNCGNKKIKD